MTMRAASISRRGFLAGAPLALAACSGGVSVRAPQEAIDRVVHRTSGPRSLTLITVKNVSSGNGAHTALLIDASQRVLFDPAGSFGHPSIPERDDVLFGFTPYLEGVYESYHARETYYVISQKVEVPAATAEQALQLALANGPVARMNCTRETSALIGRLPGFESISTTWFPNNLADDFARLPGVQQRELREDDPDLSVEARRQAAATPAR
ncbi:twin-arginine translocation signal domain-containing protein [Yoonia sp. 208BN28-4]|uniref:twin-arginine translocation signal domain-containing protein n=1 Tax=Yoonia sp. 208BN28-4 TaxID=3126505 RepID=UPI0030A15033